MELYEHRSKLLWVCRLCRCRFKTDKRYLVPKTVHEYNNEVKMLFNYNVEHDSAHIHPPNICNKMSAKNGSVQKVRFSYSITYC